MSEPTKEAREFVTRIRMCVCEEPDQLCLMCTKAARALDDHAAKWREEVDEARKRIGEQTGIHLSSLTELTEWMIQAWDLACKNTQRKRAEAAEAERDALREECEMHARTSNARFEVIAARNVERDTLRARVAELEAEVRVHEQANADICAALANANAPEGVLIVDSIGTLKARAEKAEAALMELASEINCRIEHGANSNGHLETIQDILDSKRRRDPQGIARNAIGTTDNP